MVNEEEVLARAATICLRHFPKEWGALMEAIEGYTNRRIMQCIRAPVDLLQNAQGRAQGMEEFLKALRDAPLIMEKIEKRAQAKQS